MMDMFNTKDAFNELRYPRSDKDSFVFFLKRNNLIVEITPLHSKARANRHTKLSKQALKGYLIPTDLVRDYYGD
jgi:hypothetical protein